MMLKNKKTQQNTSSGFQHHTQTTSVNINPNINNTETTENISPPIVTGISFPTSSAPITGITIQLRVPTKINRSMSDNQFDPKTSGRFTSQENFWCNFSVVSNSKYCSNTLFSIYWNPKEHTKVYSIY